MEKLKLMLEYHCFPIWYYDENGLLIDNDLPEALQNDKELDALLVDLQESFDQSFVDDRHSFYPKPFSEEERSLLIEQIQTATSLLQQRYGERYEIV